MKIIISVVPNMLKQLEFCIIKDTTTLNAIYLQCLVDSKKMLKHRYERVFK